jgi:hypothetical protein
VPSQRLLVLNGRGLCPLSKNELAFSPVRKLRKIPPIQVIMRVPN